MKLSKHHGLKLVNGVKLENARTENTNKWSSQVWRVVVIFWEGWGIQSEIKIGTVESANIQDNGWIEVPNTGHPKMIL